MLYIYIKFFSIKTNLTFIYNCIIILLFRIVAKITHITEKTRKLKYLKIFKFWFLIFTVLTRK